jgi:hypothetical protein
VKVIVSLNMPESQTKTDGINIVLKAAGLIGMLNSLTMNMKKFQTPKNAVMQNIIAQGRKELNEKKLKIAATLLTVKEASANRCTFSPLSPARLVLLKVFKSEKRIRKNSCGYLVQYEVSILAPLK